METNTSVYGVLGAESNSLTVRGGYLTQILGSTPTDQYFNLNTLLLHGDGTNNANNTVFVDSSTNSLTVTTNNKPYQGTFSPFSQTGWSIYFNGSTSYLSTPSSVDFTCGTGDFTMEFWVYIPVSPSVNYPNIVSSTTWSTGGISVRYGHTGYANKFSVHWFQNGDPFLVTPGTFALNTWHHVAFTRSGNNFTLWVNGTSQATATNSNSIDWNLSSAGMKIGGGNWDAAASYIQMYLSNLRLVKGTALYTSAFTPSTTPLSAVTNTKFLTGQSNRFIDNSSTGFTITNNNASIQPFSPFAPTTAYSNTTVGGSMYTANSGYLTLPSSTSSLYLTGAFTWEAWVYPMGNTGQMLYGHWVSNFGTANRWAFFYTPSGWNTFKLYWYRGNYGTNEAAIGTTATLTKNSWNHVAFVRDGSNNIYIFVNGVSQTLSTFSSGLAWDNGYSFTAGDANGIGGNSEYRFDGYMSGVKFVQGIANYTSNFTPPTAPPTATSNTQLLVNFTNAGIIDHTAKNALTTYGSAAISSTQSKFGGTSMYFNGSTGYITAANTLSGELGTGDFTIEMWMRASAAGTYVAMVGTQTISGFTTAGMWRVNNRHNSTNALYFAYTTGSAFTDISLSATNINDGIWHHIAVTRQSGTLRGFVDGVLGSNASVTQSLSSGKQINIGFQAHDNTYYSGYLDDVRITKGYARYTSNFTPPTSAFVDR